MQKNALTSKERLLLTMEHKQTDYVPCCFMMFHGLRDRFPGDQKRFVEEQLALGLDAVVELPELPITFHPEVSTKTWVENNVPGESCPLLHKEYYTPAGTLHTVVRKTDDWPHGDRVEFYDDYNVPRSRKFHVNEKADLKALRYLLMPPTTEQIKAYREQCAQIKEFAGQKGLMVRGVRGVLIDAAIRFAGAEDLIYAAIDDPEYLEEYLEIIWNWNMLRMEIVLDEKPDFFLRRAWYENMSFWSKDMFRRFMKQYLVKEVKWAHDMGAKFGYINTCAYMNLIDDFQDIGFDVLIGVDPVEDKQLDMAELKRRMHKKIALWGGCNGFITVEQGTREEIREETFKAMDVLAPGGGFILTPVDNVRDTSDKAIENAKILIEAWKERKDTDYFSKPVV